MNRLLQLRQDKQAALDKAQAVLTKVEAEKRSAMTPEEKAEWQAAMDEAQAIQATIEAHERMQLVAPSTSSTSHSQASGRQPAKVYDNILDKPWGYEAAANETDKQRRERVAFGFGEFLSEVKTASLKQQVGAKGDARLYALNEGFERRAQAAGASEAVPSDGGFLIAPDFSQELLMLAHDTGLVYPLTRKLPMSEFTNAVKIPAIDEQSRADGKRFGGVQMFWENEAASLVGSKPSFALIELITKKLTGLYYATNEVLSDARLLGNVVMIAFSQELGFKLDDGVIRGTGAGQLSGILNSPALIKIAKESGQGSQTVVWENIKKAWGRMWAPSRKNAVWFINQDVEQQLYGMGQVVGVGGVPVYLPPTGAAGTPYATLFGRPVVPIEQCATLGTVGDVILADFSQYVMVDKGDMQTATSMHVRFLTDEMTYRWIYRTDGQPWWKTALTPAQGSNTLSPFVVLDTR